MLNFSFIWDSPGDAIYILGGFGAVLVGFYHAGRAYHASHLGEPVKTVVEDVSECSHDSGTTYVPTLHIVNGPHSGVVRKCGGGYAKGVLATGDTVLALYDVKYKRISTETSRAADYTIAFVGVPLFLAGSVFFCYLIGPR